MTSSYYRIARHAPRNVCFAHRDRWDKETGHVSIFRKPANDENPEKRRARAVLAKATE